MTTFIRLISEHDHARALCACVKSVRAGESESRVFERQPSRFNGIPGTPFAYWAVESDFAAFESIPTFESKDRIVRIGLTTHEDFRWLRLWWETSLHQ